LEKLGLTAFGAIIGFIGSLIAEGVQRWVYGPRLQLIFENGNSAYRTPTDMGNPKIADSIYIRLRVENVKPRVAKACRAYLTRVEQRVGTDWQDTNFRDTTQLNWSAQLNGLMPMDLPRGVRVFVDLLWVFNPLPGMTVTYPDGKPRNPRHLQPSLAMELFQYARIWATDNVSYRLTVLVSGDGVLPKSHRVIVEWKGIWDQIIVSDGGAG
jgi:hypothetical protein